MKSGNSAVFKSLLIFTACLAANAGGRADQCPIDAGWSSHSESAARDATMLECEGHATPPLRDMSFERIDSRDEAAEFRRLVAQDTVRGASFDWDSQTGELSFNDNEVQAALTQREFRSPSTPALRSNSSCESR